jgi:N-hydroxyarylamine O-acetyltransferase
MIDAAPDLAAYFRRIEFDGPALPTRETLARLIERHAASIPFENIDVLCGRVPRLDVASLHEKLIERRRGGYCFEQNAFFLAALRRIGFDAAGLEGRVRSGVPAEVVTARTHMAIRVTIEGERYLADVGFGGLAPSAPLKLGSLEVQSDPVAAYRWLTVDDDLLLQCRTREGWTDCYRLAPSLPQPIDYEMANWFVATSPTAFLRHNLLVARSTPRGRLTLFNDTLTLRTPALAPEQARTLRSRSELADVVANEFGLRLDDRDLDAVAAVALAPARRGG